jgi:hypothetical protein
MAEKCVTIDLKPVKGGKGLSDVGLDEFGDISEVVRGIACDRVDVRIQKVCKGVNYKNLSQQMWKRDEEGKKTEKIQDFESACAASGGTVTAVPVTRCLRYVYKESPTEAKPLTIDHIWEGPKSGPFVGKAHKHVTKAKSIATYAPHLIESLKKRVSKIEKILKDADKVKGKRSKRSYLDNLAEKTGKDKETLRARLEETVKKYNAKIAQLENLSKESKKEELAFRGKTVIKRSRGFAKGKGKGNKKEE